MNIVIVSALIGLLAITSAQAEIFIVRSFSSPIYQNGNRVLVKSPLSIISRFFRMDVPMEMKLQKGTQDISKSDVDHLINDAETLASGAGFKSSIFNLLRMVNNALGQSPTTPSMTPSPLERPRSCSQEVKRVCGTQALRGDPLATMECLKGNLRELSPSCLAEVQDSILFTCFDSLKRSCTEAFNFPSCLVNEPELLEPACRSKLEMEGLVEKVSLAVKPEESTEEVQVQDEEMTLSQDHFSDISVYLWITLAGVSTFLIFLYASFVLYHRNRPSPKSSAQRGETEGIPGYSYLDLPENDPEEPLHQMPQE